MDTVSFEDLGLNEKVLEAVKNKGFLVPSPIQVLTIPRLLESDSNIIAKARTGTGKTAAFALPLVQTITQDTGKLQALILTPTRELAMQVCREIKSFCSDDFPKVTAVYGGTNIAGQLKDCKKGTQIIVGTPGRVMDLMERGVINLDALKYFILDEADEMLDMGFVEDIRSIFSVASKASRVLLFSATMPKEIIAIASEFMGEYEILEEEAPPEEPVLTQQCFWFVRREDRLEALVRLIDISPDFYGLVFTQTKLESDEVARKLDEKGYEANALNGDIPQQQREKILYRFRNKKTRILVATDVAARGIDIEGLTHVVNFSMPFDVASYIHRIGRTGRAGAKGLAFTFVKPDERRRLDFLRRAVQKQIKSDMKEEEIPTVEQVINVKKKHLLEYLRNELKKLYVESDISASESETEESIAEIEKQEPAAETDAGKKCPTLQIESIYKKLASKLTKVYDSDELVAALLQLTYGKQLSPEHYEKITPCKVRDERHGKRSSDEKQLRLYVGLGFVDGYGPREIGNYLSSLLHIYPRQVDRIDMADKFCLVSLPVDAARRALEYSRRDKSLPHIHVDEKEERRKNGERGFRGERQSGANRFHDEQKKGRDRFRQSNEQNYSKKRTPRDTDFSHAKEVRQKSRQRPPKHNDKTSNASLYVY